MQNIKNVILTTIEAATLPSPNRSLRVKFIFTLVHTAELNGTVVRKRQQIFNRK